MSSRELSLPGQTEQRTEKAQDESPWRVLIHNDDITPMDFVINILMTVFDVPSPNAAQVMYTAHLNGKAYVQTLPHNEARRRVGKAHFAARLSGFPLEFSLEPE